MSEPVRRSGRSRKANPRYTNDAWGKETLRLLRESSESSNPTSIESEGGSQADDNASDQSAAQITTPAEVELDEDNVSDVSGSSRSSNVAPLTAVNQEDSDNDDEVPSRITQSRTKQSSELRSRGVPLPERNKSVRKGAWQSVFGPGLDDLKPMLVAKDRWLHSARDITLPSNVTLQEAHLHGEMKSSLEADAENRSYTIHPGNEAQQRLIYMSQDEMRSRRFIVNGHDHKIVLGPWSKQRMYDLPRLESVALGQAWKVLEGFDMSYHSGWLLNLSERPQCMAWSQQQGQHQYLALACRSTSWQRDAVPTSETNTSPAFSPSAPYPVSIQIWKVSTMGRVGAGQCMDPSIPPQLIQVLACSYGDIKQMSWLPESKKSSSPEPASRLGMLVLLSTDGCARFIRVPNAKSQQTEPVCYEVVSPALKISPPADTIYTCFTFASSIDFILGTSSGRVCAYNISQSPSPTGDAVPYLNLSLQSTYMMSLCTLDGEYSHFIASSSAAGMLQLTDLRSPAQDSVVIPRSRIPTRNLVYSPHSRCFLTTIDSSGNTEPRGSAQTTLVAHSFRHFYSILNLAKYPEGSGMATAIAGSPIHPYVLVGNSGGTVWTQNVIRRILPTAKRGSKHDAGAWTQKLVEHEWIPEPTTTTTTTTTTNTTTGNNTTKESQPVHAVDLHHGPPIRQGRSRMHHGFKPEKLDLSNLGSKKRKAPASSGPTGDTAVQVVFEEEQAVTAIEWNPNPVAAGWCAIGWGSGVLWITDLSHEMT